MSAYHAEHERQSLRRKFKDFWQRLSDEKRAAARFVISDLKVAVGGSREVGEIASSYFKSLQSTDLRRRLAQSHVRQLLDTTAAHRGLWNVYVVDLEERAHEKRARLTDFGLEIHAAMQSQTLKIPTLA